MDQPAQKSARREDDRAGLQGLAIRQTESRDPMRLDPQRVDQPLTNVKTGGRKHLGLHGTRVKRPIDLGARASCCRPSRAVQQAELQTREIGHPPDQAVERVDLAHKLALAKTTDRGVARQHADIADVFGQEQRARPAPRRCRRRLAAGVPGADHDHIIGVVRMFHVKPACRSGAR